MKVLITGGASGLGEAITKKLASNSGNFVYFTYNNSVDKAKNITNGYSNTACIQCNFFDKESVASLSSKINELDIDVLINNAYHGSFINNHFNKIVIDEFENEFLLNIIPTLSITQAAIARFRKKKSGCIITILTSILTQNAPIGSSIYAANKAYLKEMTKLWAIENTKYNISSLAISPGMMLTNFTSTMDERLIEQIALKGELIDKIQVAEVICDIINCNKYLTWTDLIFDKNV